MHSASQAGQLATSAPANALWNPVAAAGWSVVFTPAFGAYLVMRNWEALGEAREAAAARVWFVFGLGLLGVRLLTAALSARLNSEPTLMHWIALLYLFAWGFGAALPQARMLKARYGGSYARRSWDQALLAAVLAGSAYFLTGACFTWLFVALT